MAYIKVSEEWSSGDPMELPLEDDMTLDLGTLQSQFPEAIGLKYKSESGSWRGLKVSGQVISHPGNDWSESIRYIVTYSKDNKRKADEGPEDSRGAAKKSHSLLKSTTDLIVLNMPYDTTETDMREYFEKFGPISFLLLKRKPDGSSRGFGFIRFKEMADQKRVISETHKMGERSLDVKIPQSKAAGFNEVTSTSGGSRLTRRIHVGNVTSRVSKGDLEDYFGEYGPITDVFMPKPTEARKNPMYAFITFADSDDAERLVETKVDHRVNGETVTVAYASPINKDGGGSSKSSRSSGAETQFNDMMDNFVDQAYSGRLGGERPRSRMEAIGMAMAMMKRWMETQVGDDRYVTSSLASLSSDYDRYRQDSYRNPSFGQSYGSVFSQGGSGAGYTSHSDYRSDSYSRY